MRNFGKLIGIIALVAIIRVFLVACTKVKLEGTRWVQSDGKDDGIIIFTSSKNVTFYDGEIAIADGRGISGTYTVSGNKVTFPSEWSRWPRGEDTYTGEILGNTLTLTSTITFGGDTMIEAFTFTKQ